MEQHALTCGEYQKVAQAFRACYGRSYLEDYTVTCPYMGYPVYDERFGRLVATNKDFYAGVPEVSDVE